MTSTYSVSSLDKVILIDLSAIVFLHANKATYASSFRDHVLKLCEDLGTPYVSFTMESSGACFRRKYAVSKEYKGTRDKSKIDEYMPYINEMFKWLRMYIPCRHYYGIENDDVFSIMGTRYDNVVLVGNDSDLLAIPGTHYNLRTNSIKRVSLPGTIEYKTGNKIKATGYFNTWSKILTGAAKENYSGLKGVGPKRAYDILKDCTTEEEMMMATAIEFYSKLGPDEGKSKLEEGYILCKLLTNHNSFVEPFAINFVEYANEKLSW